MRRLASRLTTSIPAASSNPTSPIVQPTLAFPPGGPLPDLGRPAAAGVGEGVGDGLGAATTEGLGLGPTVVAATFTICTTCWKVGRLIQGMAGTFARPVALNLISSWAGLHCVPVFERLQVQALGSGLAYVVVSESRAPCNADCSANWQAARLPWPQ